MTAAKAIESIQRKYFAKYFAGTEFSNGLPDGGFENMVATISRVLRPEALYARDYAEVLAKLLQLKEVGSYGNYQIPHELLKIQRCWSFIVRVKIPDCLPDLGLNQMMDGASESEIDLPSILLATAPMGDLNARAILGDDGSHAILFESNLITWFQCISSFMTKLFFIKKGEEYEIQFLPEERDFMASTPILTLMADFIIETVMHGEPQSKHAKGLDIGDLSQFSDFFESGMTTFTLAHELGHFVRKHHYRSSAARLIAQNKFMTYSYDMQGFWKTYQSSYAKRYPGITPWDFLQRFNRQTLEYEADVFGSVISSSAFLQNPQFKIHREATADCTGLVALHLGPSLYLWSMEIFERTLTLLANGRTALDDPLFADQTGIRDMILRASHPSPMSRIKILKTRSTGKISNGIVEPVFEALWEICSKRARELWSEGARPHPRWVDESTEMGQNLRLLRSGWVQGEATSTTPPPNT